MRQMRRYTVCFSRVCLFVCLSVYEQDYSKTRAWIWIKCCVSTDVGTWTNWLTFEPDPDHSQDPGTGFEPDFCISAGYLKKLWTDFDEILNVDNCGGTKKEVYAFARVFTSDKGGGTCFACVRLSVCLSVRKITQKRVHGFG